MKEHFENLQVIPLFLIAQKYWMLEAGKQV